MGFPEDFPTEEDAAFIQGAKTFGVRLVVFAIITFFIIRIF